MAWHGRPAARVFFAFDRSGSSFDVLGSFDFYVDHADLFACNFAILHSAFCRSIHSIRRPSQTTVRTTMESNAVVTKLQSAIANFRREKDAAQRNRDLALERLKTSGTTLENELTKTANLQSRLDDIGRKIAAGNGQEIAQKKAENDRLGREVGEIARRIGVRGGRQDGHYL